MPGKYADPVTGTGLEGVQKTQGRSEIGSHRIAGSCVVKIGATRHDVHHPSSTCWEYQLSSSDTQTAATAHPHMLAERTGLSPKDLVAIETARSRRRWE